MNALTMIIGCVGLVITSALCLHGQEGDRGKETRIDPNPANPIKLNHIGFLPNAKKVFVIDEPAAKNFQVFERREDVKYHKVLEGDLEKRNEDATGRWLGNFSEITKQGIYQIRCGTKVSRPFPIYEKVYDVAERTLLQYFTWQRCGSKKGWAGECHLDDGIIRETNEHKDFAGGYHQSCDLRKSLDGVAIGVIGAIKYALLEKPAWDEGEIAEEIRWACDYYQKLVHADGFMHDGLFIPFGWKGRYYYNSPAAPSEQWNSIRLLALGAQYFQKYGDKEYANKCLNAALRVWDFMSSDSRPVEAYKAPEPLPRGLGLINSYFQMYKNSTDDLEFRLCAAAELYRASNRLSFLHEVATCANSICERQIGKGEVERNLVGACFWESHDSTRIAGTAASYAALGGLGLCEALELMSDREGRNRWTEALEKIVVQQQRTSDKNIWSQIPQKWGVEEDFGKATACYPGGSVLKNGQAVPYYYTYGISNLRKSYQAILLTRAAKLLKRPVLIELAQRQVDWILGANPYDASSVTGLGYNQPYVPMFGQYFPPTPQIPGAVIVGITAESHRSGHGSEYDMPGVGALMWLLSELTMSQKVSAAPDAMGN